MMKLTETKPLLLCALLLAPLCIHAAPNALTSATIIEEKNDVRLRTETEERDAVVSDIVSGSRAVMTGNKSIAELEFNDQSVTRLCANTIFSFKPTSRDFELKSGFILLQVPKGKGGGKVVTPAVTAAITGTTVLISATQDGGFKMVTLEGSAEARHHKSKKKVKLKPGQMVYLTPGSSQFSRIFTVNLARIVQSSTAFTQFSKPIDSMDLIQKEIAKQSAEYGEVVAGEQEVGPANHPFQSNDPFEGISNTQDVVDENREAPKPEPPIIQPPEQPQKKINNNKISTQNYKNKRGL